MKKNIDIKCLVDNKLWLAPLAGYTDDAFRTICKMCGVDVVVTEMVSADGLVYNLNRSEAYADFSDEQRPVGIQLFGNDPQIMAKATELIVKKKPDFIDLNMGCPVKKVVRRGAGSALMTTPKIAQNIVKEMKKVLDGTGIPLSGKIRSGWDSNSINYLEFGLMLENAGLDMLCLHSRTKSQMFGGLSDWEHIKLLKEKCQIPIIGNGDIKSAADAKKMKSITGCDSIMIGRGAVGKPWIFNEIKADQNDDDYLITADEKFKIIKKHYELSIKNKGERIALLEMRAHLSDYSKGYSNSSSFRKKINQLTEYSQITSELERFFYAIS